MTVLGAKGARSGHAHRIARTAANRNAPILRWDALGFIVGHASQLDPWRDSQPEEHENGLFGYMLPPGAFVDARIKVQTETNYTIAGLSRSLPSHLSTNATKSEEQAIAPAVVVECNPNGQAGLELNTGRCQSNGRSSVCDIATPDPSGYQAMSARHSPSAAERLCL